MPFLLFVAENYFSRPSHFADTHSFSKVIFGSLSYIILKARSINEIQSVQLPFGRCGFFCKKEDPESNSFERRMMAFGWFCHVGRAVYLRSG